MSDNPTLTEEFVNGHQGHVFIVEDDRSANASMQRELISEGYRVYPFESPDLFLKYVTPVSPACLLLDMRLPEMTGVEVQARLKQLGIAIPVVFISGESTVQQAVTALESGALQFLTKPFGRLPLLDAVRKAITYSKSNEAELIRKRLQQVRVARLAPRERQVLELILAGFANQEISEKMGISYATTKQYKSNIFIKLDVQTMAELVELMGRA